MPPGDEAMLAFRSGNAPDQRVMLLAAALLAGIRLEPVLVVSEREPLVRSLARISHAGEVHRGSE